MERNNNTILGKLQKGDRFYFSGDKKKIVYEVIVTSEERRLIYNRINAYGYKMLPFDVNGSDEREVIFLRHTTIQHD